MKTKIAIILLIGALFSLFGLLIKEQERNQDLNESLETVQSEWKFDLSQKDSTIATQKQVILDKDSKLAKQSDTIQGLKSQTQRVKVITNTRIDVDTVFIASDELLTVDSTNYLKLPQKFSERSKWLSYQFRITKQGFIRDSLLIFNESHIIWGQEDHGNFVKNLFKENHPIVYIQHLNPYTSTTGVENYVFKDYKSELMIFTSSSFNTNSGLHFGALVIKNKMGYEYQYGLDKSHSIGVKLRIN